MRWPIFPCELQVNKPVESLFAVLVFLFYNYIMSESLALYVIPKTWTDPSPSNPLPSISYLDVVGAGNNEQEVVWGAEYADHQPKSEQRFSDTERLTIPSDALFSERLMGYLATYLSALPDPNNRQTGEYLCHVFSAWMEGDSSPQDSAQRSALGLVRGGQIADRNLRLGERGVFGTESRGLHSITGLGERSEQCIQASNVLGAIAITSYSAIHGHYSAFTERLLGEATHLYVSNGSAAR